MSSTDIITCSSIKQKKAPKASVSLLKFPNLLYTVKIESKQTADLYNSYLRIQGIHDPSIFPLAKHLEKLLFIFLEDTTLGKKKETDEL